MDMCVRGTYALVTSAGREEQFALNVAEELEDFVKGRSANSPQEVSGRGLQ